MEFKTLEEEIKYVYSNRQGNEFVRDESFMFRIILNATNTMTNLSSFYNDYKHLYAFKIINKLWYIKAVTDLYLLALLHTREDDWNEIIQKEQII